MVTTVDPPDSLPMLAGVIGAIVGLGLLVAAGGGVAGTSPLTAAVAGGIVLVFSVIEFAGGVTAYRGQNWYGSMTAAVLGLVTFFTLPLDLVATMLIAVGEGTFGEGGGQGARAATSACRSPIF